MQWLRRGDGRLAVGDLDFDQARDLLEAQLAAAIAQHPGRADVWVARERHLALAVEDAHARGVGGIGGWQHEGRLAEIELGGERLHLAIGHAARVGKHGQRIAAEAAVGEDVDGDEGEAAHAPF